VRLADLPAFPAAFLTSARGVATVAAVDELGFPDGQAISHAVAGVYDTVRWDRI
jgi:hypothetical protein